jgi:hemoglobin
MSSAINSSCRAKSVVQDERTLDRAFGDGDATYRACGGEDGIRGLVETFYGVMDSLPAARGIRALHPTDLQLSIDKLVCFLCGWTGGPKHYSERFGPIKIPQVHSHLPIGTLERDAWLSCMQQALAAQPFRDDLKHYLLEQLFIPAERIRAVVQARQETNSPVESGANKVVLKA